MQFAYNQMVVENATKSRLVQFNIAGFGMIVDTLQSMKNVNDMLQTSIMQHVCDMMLAIAHLFYHVARQKNTQNQGDVCPVEGSGCGKSRWRKILPTCKNSWHFHNLYSTYWIFWGPITLATQFPYRRSGGVRKRWTWISKRSSRTWKAADGGMNPKRRWWWTL